MKLSSVQKEILYTLINLYEQRNKPIKGEDIAQSLKKNSGTIRNQMQVLKQLGLVDGIPGPKGGYIPTIECYKILGLLRKEKEEIKTPVYINNREKNLKIIKIKFMNVSQPKKSYIEVHVIGDIRKIKNGDNIKIGPITDARLILEGTVIGKDDINNIILIKPTRIVNIPKDFVKNICSKKVITIKRNMIVRDVARLFMENRISGAPVIDESLRIVGIVTDQNLIYAIANDLENAPIEKVMDKNVIKVCENDDVYNVIRLFSILDTDRFVVVSERDKIIGIVTRTDIVKNLYKLIEGS